ncbi:hypothetical protein [Arcticibacter sp.]|uniref:hypothetical protein n=1 Tax=Arcticibacter sp. TaxID=1872630 RepID=UPI00388F3EBE
MNLLGYPSVLVSFLSVLRYCATLYRSQMLNSLNVMQPAILAMILFASSSCIAQTTAAPKEIYNKDFDWTITIPENFEMVSREDWQKMQNRGAEAIENTIDGTVDNQAKTIFVFNSDRFNYFESNYQPFDSTKDGNYLESHRAVQNVLYETFKAQMQNPRIDSLSSTETIDGLKFYVNKMIIYLPDDIVMELLMYSHLFGTRDFTVNILTIDKNKQNVLLQAWRESKFRRK